MIVFGLWNFKIYIYIYLWEVCNHMEKCLHNQHGLFQKLEVQNKVTSLLLLKLNWSKPPSHHWISFFPLWAFSSYKPSKAEGVSLGYSHLVARSELAHPTNSFRAGGLHIECFKTISSGTTMIWKTITKIKWKIVSLFPPGKIIIINN